MRSWARTRGRNCSPSRAHPRGRLSWRTPSSGCGSGMSTLARHTTGTDALERLPGSHRLRSSWCGSAKGMRRDWSTTGTGTRVSPRLTSLLFLLGEERYRQPRAVYKHWAGGLRSCDHAAYKFQQFLAELVDGASLQFFDRVVDIGTFLLCYRDRYPQCNCAGCGVRSFLLLGR